MSPSLPQQVDEGVNAAGDILAQQPLVLQLSQGVTTMGSGSAQTVNPLATHPELHQEEEPTLKDVLAAVTKCNSALSNLSVQVGSMQEQISFVRHDIQRVTERTTAVEVRVSDLEDKLPPLLQDVQRHDRLITTLLSKTDDLENRLRRNNIRLIGVPEKFESANPTDSFEKWLLTVFGKEILSPLYAVERAHRVPTRPLPPGAPPRPVLVKLLHYKDRDAILRAARQNPDISINGNKIAFFPDFSAEVQRRRAQFIDVKKRLRSLQAPYSMLYPAGLRVVALNGAHFFDSPKDTASWLDQHERQLRREEG